MNNIYLKEFIAMGRPTYATRATKRNITCPRAANRQLASSAPGLVFGENTVGTVSVRILVATLHFGCICTASWVVVVKGLISELTLKAR